MYTLFYWLTRSMNTDVAMKLPTIHKLYKISEAYSKIHELTTVAVQTTAMGKCFEEQALLQLTGALIRYKIYIYGPYNIIQIILFIQHGL